jgi:hypothetical protein
VLADELAETVTDLRATAVPVAIRLLWRKLLNWIRKRSDFLDRADADAVGLAQGAIDSTGLSHAHLRPANERGNVGRIGVAVADKTGGALGRENRCLEDEPIRPRITQRIDGFNMDAAAPLATRQPN